MDQIPLGNHVTLDMFCCQCEEIILADASKGLSILSELGKYFKPLSVDVHQFQPYSYTGLMMLEESHISIHTWTQFQFASLDLYTCDGKIPQQAVAYAVAMFRPKRTVRVDIVRGTTNPIVRTETDYDSGN